MRVPDSEDSARRARATAASARPGVVSDSTTNPASRNGRMKDRTSARSAAANRTSADPFGGWVMTDTPTRARFIHPASPGMALLAWSTVARRIERLPGLRVNRPSADRFGHTTTRATRGKTPSRINCLSSRSN